MKDHGARWDGLRLNRQSGVALDLQLRQPTNSRVFFFDRLCMPQTHQIIYIVVAINNFYCNSQFFLLYNVSEKYFFIVTDIPYIIFVIN
jgi:hypothetical protein